MGAASQGPRVQAAREADVCGALGCTERQPLYRVRHPEKGVRVVCEEHTRRLARSISDRRPGPAVGTFKSSGFDRSGSTEPRSGRSVVGNKTGSTTPSPCSQSMRASESTPGEGESAVGASDSERAVRLLAADSLDDLSRELEELLRRSAKELQEGDLSRRRLAQLRSRRDRLDEIVDATVAVSPSARKEWNGENGEETP